MDLNSLSQNPEQIKQLIGLLQSLLPDPNKNELNDNKMSQSHSSVVQVSSAKKSNNEHHNKFLSMPEMNMHKEDSELDKKLVKHPPVARSREYDPVNVMCRICGKKEMISPSLVESSGRYKCNKCSSSAG